MKEEREKTATEPAGATQDADVEAPRDSVRPGGYCVSLPEFDGPLDLLLCLIQEHELDILNIPIGFIASKYVEYITLMQQVNIDLASEYLVMAATLAHIKSKMLLPAPPEDQEEGDEIDLDPRAELVRRLLEYQKYKHVAEQLAARELLGRDVFVRAAGNPIPEGQAPLAPVTLFRLLEAFKRILDRAHKTLDHQIQFDRLSITDRINELVDVLRERERFDVSSLFEEQRSRSELVVTLLALLEMTRLRMIRLTQIGPLEEITVELAVSEGQAAVAVAVAVAAAAAKGEGGDASAASDAGEPDPLSRQDSEPVRGEPAGEEDVTSEQADAAASAGTEAEPAEFLAGVGEAEPVEGEMPEAELPEAGAATAGSVEAEPSEAVKGDGRVESDATDYELPGAGVAEAEVLEVPETEGAVDSSRPESSEARADEAGRVEPESPEASEGAKEVELSVPEPPEDGVGEGQLLDAKPPQLSAADVESRGAERAEHQDVAEAQTRHAPPSMPSPATSEDDSRDRGEAAVSTDPDSEQER